MFNKIKYQNQNFRQKLKQARGYKRPYKKIPETKVEFFLSMFHLDTFLGKTVAVIVFLALIYIIYIPNFLRIKTVEILGISEVNKPLILKSIEEYFSLNPFIPKRNFLFFSKRGLKNFLAEKNTLVEKVLEINKDFPNKIVIQISERYNKFILQNTNSSYIVSNDGLIVKQLSSEDLNNLSTSTLQSLLTLNIKQNNAFYENQKATNDDFFENLNQILNKANSELQNPITQISIENFEHPNFEVKTKKNYTIKFDINSDIQKTFEHLALLLKDIGEDRINGVKYIDMRIKDRGYVCYKDALCASDALPEKASTTPIN